MIAGLMVPGRSVLHRLPAGWKLAGLAVLGGALFPLTSPWLLSAVAVAVALAYPACGLGWRRVWVQVRGLGLFLILIAASQAWVSGWSDAVVVTARLLALVLAASLVTYTTAMSAMMETLERLLAPTARLGLNPAALSFSLSLAIRFVPVLTGLAREIQEATAARGRGRAWAAMAAPLVLRALRLADQVSEAVEARGLDSAPQGRS